MVCAGGNGGISGIRPRRGSAPVEVVERFVEVAVDREQAVERGGAKHAADRGGDLAEAELALGCVHATQDQQELADHGAGDFFDVAEVEDDPGARGGGKGVGEGVGGLSDDQVVVEAAIEEAQDADAVDIAGFDVV